MQILIIEDNDKKLLSINGFLQESLGTSLVATVVDSMAAGLRAATLLEFDLVILDLMIPYIKDGAPDSEAGYELLRQIRLGGPNRHTKVIAISAHPEEVSSYREKFDALAVVIVKYDDTNIWKKTLAEICGEISNIGAATVRIDFLIVCALDEEREAFSHTKFTPVADATIKGLNVRYVKDAGGRAGAILKPSQMGLVTATYETAMALEVFNPRIVAMSGICAGLGKDVHLGQVVAAAMAWDYQAGKWSQDGFEIAPLQVPIPALTRSTIAHIFDEKGLVETLEADLPPRTNKPLQPCAPLIVPMATGSAVIADESRLAHILVQHRKVAALDMETFGVYYAAHEHSGKLRHFFSVKAIVDFADREKEDGFHAYGCVMAALMTARIIVELA